MPWSKYWPPFTAASQLHLSLDSWQSTVHFLLVHQRKGSWDTIGCHQLWQWLVMIDVWASSCCCSVVASSCCCSVVAHQRLTDNLMDHTMLMEYTAASAKRSTGSTWKNKPHSHTHTHTHTHIYTYTHICMHTHTCACLCIHTHTHMHTHKHTCVCFQERETV